MRAGHSSWHGQEVRRRTWGLLWPRNIQVQEVQPLGWSTQAPATGELRRIAHRLDVPVQEAHGVNGFDGLQDLLAQPQCSA